MNKSPDKRYIAKYKPDGDTLSIPARHITIANAVARLYSNGRKYTVKEVQKAGAKNALVNFKS